MSNDLKEDVVTNVVSNFPIVYFDDGLYGEVKRHILKEGKSVLYIDPAPAVLIIHADLKKEFNEFGYLELEFPPEYIVDLNKDPVFPSIRVLSDIKCQRKSIIYEELLKTIDFLKSRNEHLKLCLLHQDNEMSELLENYEGNIERHERIRNKMRVPPNPVLPGYPAESNPTDSGQDGG